MTATKKTLLASLLLENQLVTREQLDKAFEVQKKSDKKIGQILIDLGYIKEEQLLQLLSKHLHVPFIDLKTYPLEPNLVRILPEFYSRHFRAIVLKDVEHGYLIGMVDPQDLLGIDEIRAILNKNLEIALVREDDLLSALDAIYRRSDEISHFAETLEAELKPLEKDIFTQTQDLSTEDMPVVNLLRSIFEDAVQVDASDIHIEPGEKVLYIRLRVDGVLQEQILDETTISQALVQRVKLISGLNIAEKRLPQDGRFTIKVKNKQFDVRVSTIPAQYGESVVMRLLNQSATLLKLDQIGMPEDVYKAYRQILTATYGLILMVGPTGSGKTTTLYASLNELNTSEDKIITVEDPVEYRLPRINQIQVNPQIGLTFASILRSILRQDPDIIMIGEMRDMETMEIAIRAAMTGHLVLATLHTNDTLSSITRLLDMGAQGYLVASVLRAILAQRLVRRICTFCIADDELTTQEKNWLDGVIGNQYKKYQFKKGQGCTHCHHTGYQGRIGIFELLPMTTELTNALRHEDTSSLSQLAKKIPVYHTLLQSGLTLAEQHVTTVQEVIRLVGEF